VGVEHLPLPPSGLTAEEATFVYNAEVLGLPTRKAATLAGMDLSQIYAPHIAQARELAKKAFRESVAFTKEDVVRGMHEAIGRAKLFAEPMTEIIGWEKIAKILGYDSAQKVDINITASVAVLREHVRALPESALIEALGANTVIDADFYEIQDTP